MKLHLCSVVACFTTLAGTASATVTGYSSSASWLNAINAAGSASSMFEEDYSTATPNAILPNGTVIDGITYDFDVAGGTGEGYITTMANSVSGNTLASYVNGSQRAFYPNEGFTLTFPSAINFFGIYINTQLPESNSITIDGQTVSATGSSYDKSTFVFLGVISNNPFDSLTFRGSIHETIRSGFQNSSMARSRLSLGQWLCLF